MMSGFTASRQQTISPARVSVLVNYCQHMLVILFKAPKRHGARSACNMQCIKEQPTSRHAIVCQALCAVYDVRFDALPADASEKQPTFSKAGLLIGVDGFVGQAECGNGGAQGPAWVKVKILSAPVFTGCI